jgi:hypothetical protein
MHTATNLAPDFNITADLEKIGTGDKFLRQDTEAPASLASHAASGSK